MTSLRQLESNRRNALRSTGPKTDGGKNRASRNAVRHGLTAETVVAPFEDLEDYKAFEQVVTADYEAETAVERELVLRLASLLWRSRRATLIETNLLQIQNEILGKHRMTQQPQPSYDQAGVAVFRFDQVTVGRSDDACSNGIDRDAICGDDPILDTTPPSQAYGARFIVARCFLSLANLDNGVFERLGRYETALWRQARQTLFALERLRWRTSSARWRTQRRWHGIEVRPL